MKPQIIDEILDPDFWEKYERNEERAEWLRKKMSMFTIEGSPWGQRVRPPEPWRGEGA